MKEKLTNMHLMNGVFTILVSLFIIILLIPLNFNARLALDSTAENNSHIDSAVLYYENDSKIYEAENNEIIMDFNPRLSYDAMDVECNDENLIYDLYIGDIKLYSLNPYWLKIHSNASYQMIHGDLPLYSLDNLLDTYAKENYLVILAVQGSFHEGMTQEIQDKFEYLGIENTPYTNDPYSSFYAVINNGKTIATASSKDNSEYSASIGKGGLDLYVQSKGSSQNVFSTITINDNINCAGRNGLNVLVYDLKKNYLVDSLAYPNQYPATPIRDSSSLQEVDKISYTNAIFDIFYVCSRILLLSYKGISIFMIVTLLLLWNSMRVVKNMKFNSKLNKLWFIHNQSLVFIIIVVTILILVGYNYLCINFSDASISQIIFHANTNLEGTNWADFYGLFIKVGVLLLMGVFFVILLSIIARKRNWYFKLLACSTIIAAVCISLIGITYKNFNKHYKFYEYLISTATYTSLYEDNYVDPSTAEITFPKDKKNLIYIFLESTEITLADSSLGGAKTDNYIKELSDIALENECFAGNENILNGANVLGKTTWTSAAMIAQTSGVTLNYNPSEKYLPGAYSIGQILADNGYKNYLLIGSDSVFGERDLYFTQHGNYKICDYNWAINSGKLPSDYYEWWGYEDEKLFEYAKEQLTDLSKKDTPFNFTMLTADTHFTDGYLCHLCNSDFDQQYSNVYACSSKQVAEFLDWLKEQDFYEDTVVIFSGDHLSMDSTYFADVNNTYTRKTYFSIINSDTELKNSDYREFCTLDIFPTTLGAMGCGIKGNRLGLGTNLYSDTQTLIEELGKENFDNELKLNSKYYIQKINY